MTDEQLILAAVRSGIGVYIGSRKVDNQLSIESLQSLYANIMSTRHENKKEEPFKLMCPRCGVDRVHSPCPNIGRGVEGCPMTGIAQ